MFGGVCSVMDDILVDNDHDQIIINRISIGREAKIVYIIIYILAWTRSG